MTGQASGLRSAAGPLLPREAGHRGAAHPALTPAHSGPGEQFDGAGVAGTETGDGFLDPPGRDLLAAADVGVLAQPAGPAGARRMGGGHGPGEPPQPVPAPPQRTAGDPPRDVVRRQLPFREGEFRTPHAPGLTGRPDPVDRGPLPVVEHQRPGAVRGTAGGAAQCGGQLQLRYEPVPDGERVARDAQSGPGHRPPVPVEPGQGDGLDPVGAVHGGDRAAGTEAYAVPEQGDRVTGPFGELARGWRRACAGRGRIRRSRPPRRRPAPWHRPRRAIRRRRAAAARCRRPRSAAPAAPAPP